MACLTLAQSIKLRYFFLCHCHREKAKAKKKKGKNTPWTSALGLL
jgi:hypothetical protein